MRFLNIFVLGATLLLAQPFAVFSQLPCPLPNTSILEVEGNDDATDVQVLYEAEVTLSPGSIQGVVIKHPVMKDLLRGEFEDTGSGIIIRILPITPAFNDYLDDTGIDTFISSTLAEGIAFTTGSDEYQCFLALKITDTNNKSPEFLKPGPPSFTVPSTSWNTELALNWRMQDEILVTDRDWAEGFSTVNIRSDEPSIIRGVVYPKSDDNSAPRIYGVQLFLDRVVAGTYTITATDGEKETPINVEILTVVENIFPPEFQDTNYFYAFDTPPSSGSEVPVDIIVVDRDSPDTTTFDIATDADYLNFNPATSRFVFTREVDFTGQTEDVLVTATENLPGGQSQQVTLTLKFPDAPCAQDNPKFPQASHISQLIDWPADGREVDIGTLTPTTADGEETVIDPGTLPNFLSITDDDGDGTWTLTFIEDMSEDTELGQLGANRVVVFELEAYVVSDDTRRGSTTIVITFPPFKDATTEPTTPCDPSTTDTAPPCDCSTTTEPPGGTTCPPPETCEPCDCSTTTETPGGTTCPPPETCEPCTSTEPPGGTTCPPPETCEPCTSTETPGTTCPPPETCEPCTSTEPPGGSTCSPENCPPCTTEPPEGTPCPPCTTEPPEGTPCTTQPPEGTPCPPCTTEPPTTCSPDVSTCPPCTTDPPGGTTCPPTETPPPGGSTCPACPPCETSPPGGGTCPPCTNPPSTCPPCPCEQGGDEDCKNTGLVVAVIVTSVLCAGSICVIGYVLYLLRRASLNPPSSPFHRDNSFLIPKSSIDAGSPSIPPASTTPAPNIGGYRFANPRASLGNVAASATSTEPGFTNPAFSNEEPPKPKPAPNPRKTSIVGVTSEPPPYSSAAPSPAQPSVDNSPLYSTPMKKSNIKTPKEIDPDYEEGPIRSPENTGKSPPERKISSVSRRGSEAKPRVLFAPEDEVRTIDDPTPKVTGEGGGGGGGGGADTKIDNLDDDSDSDYERL